MKQIYDITRGMFSTEPYPGDPVPALDTLQTIPDAGYRLSVLRCCCHAGTHIDAPSHYIEGGAGIAEIPLQTFCGRCAVWKGQPLPGRGQLRDWVQEGISILLLQGEIPTSFSKAAVEEGIVFLGTDAPSIGREPEEEAVHRILLQAGIPVLENADLDGVPAGEYRLAAFPLKLEGAEAAPVRAVLWIE